MWNKSNRIALRRRERSFFFFPMTNAVLSDSLFAELVSFGWTKSDPGSQFWPKLSFSHKLGITARKSLVLGILSLHFGVRPKLVLGPERSSSFFLTTSSLSFSSPSDLLLSSFASGNDSLFPSDFPHSPKMFVWQQRLARDPQDRPNCRRRSKMSLLDFFLCFGADGVSIRHFWQLPPTDLELWTSMTRFFEISAKRTFL